MAATQYQIFVRYLNESIGKPLTNKTQAEWISAEDLIEIKKFYTEIAIFSYKKIKLSLHYKESFVYYNGAFADGMLGFVQARRKTH